MGHIIACIIDLIEVDLFGLRIRMENISVVFGSILWTNDFD